MTIKGSEIVSAVAALIEIHDIRVSVKYFWKPSVAVAVGIVAGGLVNENFNGWLEYLLILTILKYKGPVGMFVGGSVCGALAWWWYRGLWIGWWSPCDNNSVNFLQENSSQQRRLSETIWMRIRKPDWSVI